MDIEMFGKISDAFGPSGFEEEVVRTVAGYCGKYQVENDAMNNLYVRMPGRAGDKPVVQLDAHLDECGFMVQCIHDNGCLGILMLGGFHLTNLPAHTVIIKTRAGRKIRGIIMSKPVHFMNDKERASLELCIENLYVDFSYDEEHGLCFGKAFDNRAGCACIVDTMDKVYDSRNELAVDVVGAFAAQEEVGMRGATVTTQVVKPDLAILFEGSPSDDFFFSATQAQGRMKNGVQIRRMDKSYISNPVFMEYAMELAGKFGIRYQEAVRRGGSTNAGRISLIGKAVPVLVLGVPSRYVHSHYNFCAKDDLEAATELAAQVIKGLDGERIRHILRQDIL